jgi:hypothetical protein
MESRMDGRKTKQSELPVRTRVKRSSLAGNHSLPALKVRLTGARIIGNHNRRLA